MQGEAMGKSVVEQSNAGRVVVAGREAMSAAHARAEELLAKALALRERISRDFWDLGRVLVLLRDEKMHVPLGYDRFDAMVDARLGLPRTLAWKLISVAEGLPRTDAARLGQERAYAVVALARIIPEVESPTELLGREDIIAGVPLAEASLRDLQSAVRAARPKVVSTLAKRQAARELKALLRTARDRLAPLGIPRARTAVAGEELVVRLPLDLAKRLFGAA